MNRNSRQTQEENHSGLIIKLCWVGSNHKCQSCDTVHLAKEDLISNGWWSYEGNILLDVYKWSRRPNPDFVPDYSHDICCFAVLWLTHAHLQNWLWPIAHTLRLQSKLSQVWFRLRQKGTASLFRDLKNLLQPWAKPQIVICLQNKLRH